MSIPTWQEFWAANPDPDAVVPLGWGRTGSGGGRTPTAAATRARPGRNLSRIIDKYWDGLVAATANNPRVRLIKKPVGKTATGLRDIQFYVLATPQNMANLEDDAAFWRGVRSGEISEEVGLRGRGHQARVRLDHGHPHGGESAAAESITRAGLRVAGPHGLRERAAAEAAGLLPAARPQPGRPGRRDRQRTTAWGFDPNRDFGTWNQDGEPPRSCRR